ncbi:NADP-dependent oxidoreductase [Thermaurantiacus sp.]
MKRRRFTLVRRPKGVPVAADFALTEAEVPALGEGEFLVANRFASLDPAIRGWLDDAPSYMPPVPLGEAVRASTVGEVVESRNPAFPTGQWVVGLNAIETHSVARSDGFTSAIDVRLASSPTHFLSVLGAVGMTAWFGVERVLKPEPGQTLLVSAAAGAVGSLVGQLGRLRGLKTIGIAGGEAKCRRLVERYGYAAAIDHRGKDAAAMAEAIRAAAPEGVDLVFENVGGSALDGALMNLNDGARIALCGLISEYNAEAPVGARNLWQLIVKKATIRGFLVSEWLPEWPQGIAAMAELLREGRLVADEHIECGLDRAFAAFMRLFEGTNEGKMILEIA